MKKLLKKAWEKLVGVKKDESTEEVKITLNRARRRFLAKYLRKSGGYSTVQARHLPLEVSYADAVGICAVAGVDIHQLLDVS